MDELRRLIRTEMDRQKLTYRAAAERANGLISYSHLSNIVNGRHTGELDDRTLAGIALAIGATEAKVRRAYAVTNPRPLEFTVPDKARHLTPKQRAAVLSMIDAFLDGNKRDSK